MYVKRIAKAKWGRNRDNKRGKRRAEIVQIV